MQCAKCGSDNAAASRFCSHCGATLMQAAAAPPAVTAPDRRGDETLPEGALKMVTLMFCDLVGSTRLIAGLAPEQAMKLYGSAVATMVRAIAAAGGTVIDSMGDGVLAVFGAPLAQPDHARRACVAGASVRSHIAEMVHTEFAFGVAVPQVRVGLHSAQVAVAVIRDGKRVSCKLYGEGVNMAARIQSAAEPDSVFMTETTYARVKGTCEAVNAGARKLKGFDKPVRLYKLVSLNAPAPLERVTSPLVGREAELAALAATLDRLRPGGGALCLLFGEPGVGKTRLVDELRPLASARNMRWAQGHSPPFSERLSYWPIIEVLRMLLAPSEGAAAATPSYETLHASLRQVVGDEADEMAPYVAALLSVPLDAELTERLPPAGSEAMAHQMSRWLFRLFRTFVQERPLVLVLDDLQWADASSIAVVKHLCAIAAELPLLIIGVARPDSDRLELAHYMQERHAEGYLEIALEPLGARDAAALLDALMPLADSAIGLCKLILERADGNPFFVEEIALALKQADIVYRDEASGKWLCRLALEQVRIPESIRDTVLARIDRLNGDLRKTLCNASVIGREFLYRILDAITDRGLELDRQLAQLRSLDLVSQGPHAAELEYMFKHAVVQEAVYSSIFEERRQNTHLRVAECLESLFAEELAPHYGVLAFHFYRAGRWDKAQAYLLGAADQAQRLAGDSEALAYLEQALAMVEQGTVGKLDPLDAARIERKLGQIRFRRGDPERAIPHFRRALQLLKDRDPLTPTAVRLRIAYEAAWHVGSRACRALLPKPGARAACGADAERRLVYEHLGWCNYHTDQERLLLSILRGANLGAARGDADALALSYAGIGYAFNLVGAFGVARNYLRHALDYAKRSPHVGTAALPRNVMGLHCWYVGAWEQAHAHYAEGVRCALEAGDSNNWMSIHAQQAWLYLAQGELARSFGVARVMTETGRESAMATGIHWGLLGQGRVLLRSERREEGLELVKEALARARRMPDYQCIAQAQGSLALYLMEENRPDEASELIERALPMLRAHRLLGHDAAETHVAAAQVAVRRAEQAESADAAQTVSAARRACNRALRQSRIVSSIRPAALRALARLEWFAGERAAAERLWSQSAASAESIGARLELAATLHERAELCDDRTLQAAAQALRRDIRNAASALSHVQAVRPG
jgi:class 3 adenylate cyclase/tetratricopeptide (TPR) repeat protein